MQRSKFKKGDLVQVRNREVVGIFVLMKDVGKAQMWVQVYSMKDSKIHHELVNSLEVVYAKR